MKPGQKLCPRCYEQKSLPQHYQGKQAETDGTFQPAEASFSAINESALSLDVTPLKTSVSKRDKPAYGKRKVKQLQSKIKAKCAHALDLQTDDLATTEEEDSSDGQSDLDRLMFLLKEKASVATRQEKIKLLTLAPESWSKKKTMEEFGVTEHVVRRARQLKKDKGILADPDPKKGKTFLQEVTQRIQEFYQSDEFSRLCPGKKDFVIIKSTSGKEYKQKRLLLLNLKELYHQFKQLYPQDRVGFSKFCELRPKWCVTVDAPGMHNICVCEHHQNAKLITASIPENISYKDILEKLVCSVENRDCMLHLCENCPGKDALEDYLSEIFANNDYDTDDTIVYKQWVHTDRTSLVQLTASVQEFIQIAVDNFNNLRSHHFIAKSQSAYLSKQKEDLAPYEAIVLLDFAENYSIIVQDEVQGHHWTNTQATLHPFVVYYRDAEGVKSLSTCMISDCLKHDVLAVHCFISKMASHVKSVLPAVQKLIYFSDGAASQFKNFKNFMNLCCHKSDHGLEAEWNFFATSHGKSPCDGIGGTVKRLVAKASLQQTTTNQILTPKEMFEWASKNISGINFFYVTTEEISNNAAKFDLATRFSSAKTLPGTRSHHSFIPTSNVELRMKRVSADKDFTTIRFGPHPQQHAEADDESVSLQQNKFQPGKYVACIYDREWYVGTIAEYSEEHGDIYVDFMKRSKKGFFSWPPASRRDLCWVPIQHVICVIEAPCLQGRSARSYRLSAQDEAHIHEKLPSFS